MASRALKIGRRKAGTTTSNAGKVSEDAVAALAYQLWQERGCPVGSDKDDWFRAERELQGSTEQQTAI